MKKVLCLIMVFALCFATVGYASEATPTDMKTVKKNNKKATPTDVSEDIDSASIFGKTVNGNYENEFLGLGFKLKDWHLYSEQELAAVNQVSNDLISSKVEQDIGLADNLTIMMASAQDDKASINIVLRNMKEYVDAINMMGVDKVIESSLDTSREMYAQAGFENVKMDSAKINVENKDYAGTSIYYEVQGVPSYLKQIWLVRGEYVAYITITSMNEDTTDEIVKNLYHLK